MLPLTTLAPHERTATVAEIRDVVDLAEMVCEVPMWQHADGAAFKVRLRALSFRERTAVHQAARTAAGEDDDDQFALETCLRGMVEPRLDPTQLDILRAKNPEVIDALADTIWRLTRLAAHAVEAEVRRLTELPPAPVEPPHLEPSATPPGAGAAGAAVA